MKKEAIHNRIEESSLIMSDWSRITVPRSSLPMIEDAMINKWIVRIKGHIINTSYVMRIQILGWDSENWSKDEVKLYLTN